MSGKLFIISAPSGAGKTTLVKHLLDRLQKNYSISRVVTYTTKSPRAGESVQGEDFYFVTQADFERKIAQGYFVEWSNAYGNYYGTPCYINERLERGESLVLILDRTGAQQIKEVMPCAILIWIYTKSIHVLRERLSSRGVDSQKQIEQRLLLACKEIEQESTNSCYQYHVLNEDFVESLAQLNTIFLNFLNG